MSALGDFERGVTLTLRIFKAGVAGIPMPPYAPLRKSDAQALYSAGVLAAAEEIDALVTDATLNPSLARGGK